MFGYRAQRQEVEPVNGSGRVASAELCGSSRLRGRRVHDRWYRRDRRCGGLMALRAVNPPRWRSAARRSALAGGALDGLQQDLLGLGGVAPAVQLDPLAPLQVLVVLEEVADALQPVRRAVADVAHVGIAGNNLGDRHGED